MNCDRCSKEMCLAEDFDGTCLSCLQPRSPTVDRINREKRLKFATRMTLILIAALQFGCVKPKEHHFVYKGDGVTPAGWYEDLYVCCAYPAYFCRTVVSHDIDGAKNETEYFARIYVPTTDYIECERSEKQ